MQFYPHNEFKYINPGVNQARNARNTQNTKLKKTILALSIYINEVVNTLFRR